MPKKPTKSLKLLESERKVKIREIPSVVRFIESIPLEALTEIFEIASRTDERATEVSKIIALGGPEGHITGNMLLRACTNRGIRLFEIANWVVNWLDEVNRPLLALEVFHIIRATAKDALSIYTPCDCGGKDPACDTCYGTGEVQRRKGDRYARQQLFEIRGLIEGKGIDIHNDNRSYSVTPQSIEDIIKRAQRALHIPIPIVEAIEAEVEPVPQLTDGKESHENSPDASIPPSEGSGEAG